MARKNLIQASFNFDIWGINSSMEDYRLCLHINEFLNWQLKRVHDVEIFVNDAKNIKYFSAYKYNNDIDLYTVELIQNKKLGNILIPELKNIDYLFLFNGEDDYFDKDAFINSLLNSPGVQSIFPIDVNLLKSRHNLLTRHFNEPSNT